MGLDRVLTTDVLTVVKQADALLPLSGATLPEPYYYHSMTLCVVDAVFSIGVRYEGVTATVERYCGHYGVQRLRPDPRTVLPPREQQECISDLCRHFDERDAAAMARDVFQNKQRTSTRSGIVKAEAVKQFALALKAAGIEYLQDAPRGWDSLALDRAVRAIPGQASGISLQYFWMLAGSDDLIKPDRMILRFLEGQLGRTVAVVEAQGILAGAAAALKSTYPHISPRLLDFKIWEHQRQSGPPGDSNG
jgi:hypothetical protein